LKSRSLIITTEWLTIGELAERAGIAPSALRFYESKGLIESERTEGNQRRYGRDGLERLGFIRHARDLGLSLEAIRELIALDPSDHVRTHRIAETHLEGIRARIERLKGLEQELMRISASCAGEA